MLINIVPDIDLFDADTQKILMLLSDMSDFSYITRFHFSCHGCIFQCNLILLSYDLSSHFEAIFTR